MIYCGAAPDWCFEGQDEIDTSLCTTDEWGVVDCSAAGCEGNDDNQEPCWNLYRSILNSSFWTLMNLFGEFALVDQHSVWGKVLGTFTAVFAVAVFALPVGVLASGFEDQIARRRELKRASEAKNQIDEDKQDDAEDDDNVMGDESTLRGAVYNFLHHERSPSAKHFTLFTHVLIVGCAIAFMFDTVTDIQGGFHSLLRWFQFFSFLVFVVQYVLMLYSAGENPKYRGRAGLIKYATSFLRLVDICSIFPYWGKS